MSGCDIKSLPLRPAEAFLLSRIDATVSEHDLSLLTGLPAHEVAAALDRLAQMGAIHFGGADQPKAPPPPERPPPQSERSLRMLAAQAGRPALDAGSPSPPLYDPAELDEDVEIDPVRKRRVLDLFYRLDDLTHYELLGVPGEVEKKQIKSAYYQLAPEFHPDTYFRKKLGSYKAKIEAVFTRITLAHDVLTSKQRRAEYDAYLEQTHRNRVMEALLDRTPRDLEAVAAAVDESAAATARIEPQRAGAKPPVADVVAASLGRYTSETRSPEEIARERREMLARKLRGGASTRPPPASMPPPASDPHAEEVASQRRAAGALKARYEAAVAEGKRQQLARYLELGRVALDRKDYAAAANAYRIASSLAPDDAQVQATCDEATRLAAAALAEGYWKQAQYEAGQERWGDAALSYSRVCAGRPTDARAHERVAFATLKSSTNARRAVEFARRAIELAPLMADIRVTLARAYMAAGLERSAAGELERAIELAPNDAKIKELVAQARSPSQKGGKVS